MNPSNAAARPLDRAAVAEIGRWLAATLIALLWCAALLLIWRRVAGALSQPLPPSMLVAAGVLAAATAVTARAAWQRLPTTSRRSPRRWLVAALPTVAVLALGAALSVPQTATGGLVAFWVVLAIEEIWAWGPLLRRRPRQGATASQTVRVDPPQSPAPHASPARPSAPPLPVDPSTVPPEGVLQQLTRSQGADGSEQLAGWLRMPFSPGQRTASVHVAFCPPFARTPELAVEQIEGPPTRIKTAQLLPHGVRLDLKLGIVAEEPLDVLLQFAARCAERD